MTLVNLFLFYFSWDLLGHIAWETNQYATEDWVKPVGGHGIEGEVKDQAVTKKGGILFLVANMIRVHTIITIPKHGLP